MKLLVTRCLSALGGQLRTPPNGKPQLSYSKGLLVALSALALSWLTPVHAQQLTMRATLPFQFHIGDKVLDAGNYIVEIDQQSHTIVFRNATEYAAVTVGLPTAYRDEQDAFKGRLQFADYGETHVLRKIWTGGESKGYVIQESKAEHEIARRNAKKPSLTEVASR